MSTFKEECCAIGAMWLSDFLRALNFADTGDSQLNNGINLLRIMSNRWTYKKEVCDQFEAEMFKKLMELDFPILLHFDYHPHPIVRDVFQRVLHTNSSGMLNFPEKGCLTINGKGVFAATGYGSRLEQIY